MFTRNNNILYRCIALLLFTVVFSGALAGCTKENPPEETSTAPTEIHEPPDSGTQAATQPVETLNGTVITEELNVREGVGISYEIVTTLKEGDRVAILEQKDLNGVMWGRIENGWICLVYVHIDGTPLDEEPEEESAVLEQPIDGKVLATELNIRTGPGTNHTVCGSLMKDDNVTVTEIKGNWGKTEAGWINTIFVYFPDSLDSETIQAVVNADELNVRTGPSTAYESLYKVNTGHEITIYKQVTMRGKLWGYIGDGWLSMDYVDIK